MQIDSKHFPRAAWPFGGQRRAVKGLSWRNNDDNNVDEDYGLPENSWEGASGKSVIHDDKIASYNGAGALS